MKWDIKLIKQMEDCLWDLVDTTKMSGNTLQDAIEALHEKEAQIKVNGDSTSHRKALHKHFVTNNEVSVCIIKGCNNNAELRGVCMKHYLGFE